MCVWKLETDWQTLAGRMRENDILSLSSLQELLRDGTDIQKKLSYCEQNDIRINLKGHCLDKSVYMDILELLQLNERQRKERLRAAQKSGIEKALERNKQGLGSYGRPRMELPEDFETQIRFCRSENISLEQYRRKTGLKKATFYKYAKLVGK